MVPYSSFLIYKIKIIFIRKKRPPFKIIDIPLDKMVVFFTTDEIDTKKQKTTCESEGF